MPVANAIASSYKSEVLSGVHVAADVYKIALIKVGATGNYGAGTTNVGTPGAGAPTAANLGTDEAVGIGYISGGATLAGFSVTGTTTARLDFTSPTWPNATISAIGAIIYNSTKGNKVVVCCDFGGTITSTNGTFAANMPAVGDATSLVRFA